MKVNDKMLNVLLKKKRRHRDLLKECYSYDNDKK